MKNVYALQFTTSSRATISMRGSSKAVSFEYSYDGIDWSIWNLSALIINSGDTLYIRGNNPRGLSHKNIKYYKFIMEGGKVSCSGNIMSLIDYKNLPDAIPCDYCFFGLFESCTSLVNAPELPATTLTKWCYDGMFSGCTSLKIAPELPATKLADFCFRFMFSGCTSLTTAPELPASKLAKDCYYQMFDGCTSLKNKPQLTESYKSRMTFKEYCQSHLSS